MLTETITRPPRTIREVFENLPEGTLAQLIENNIVMSPSPYFKHQQVLDKVYRQIGNFVEANNLGQTLTAPMDVYLDGQNIYQPDILFISNERQHIIRENGIHGAPDLIIEILSPATARYDLNKKKKVYERSGVKEYWVIDPATKIARGFSLKNLHFEEFAEEKEKLHSELLGVSIAF